MRLKKNLKCSGQSIMEYIAIFAVLTLGIVVVCGGFNPAYETSLSSGQTQGRPVMKITQAFQTATNAAISHISSWK